MEQKLFESCFNQKMNTFISQHSKNQIEEKFLRLTINNNFVKIFSDENTKVFIEQSQQLSKKYFAKQEQKLILEIENKQQELKKLQETKKIQVEPKDDSSEDDLFNSEELNSTLTLLSQTQKSTQNEVDKEGLSHTQTSTQKEVDKEDQTEKDGHGQEGALEDILSSQGILIQQQEVEEPKIKKIKIELKN